MKPLNYEATIKNNKSVEQTNFSDARDLDQIPPVSETGAQNLAYPGFKTPQGNIFVKRGISSTKNSDLVDMQ